MTSLLLWVQASRPKTLVAALSPVLLGTAFALRTHLFSPLIFCATLLCALLIQIGTNFANDYYDFLKGADTCLRKGPRRLIQQGIVLPNQMKRAVFITFSIVGLLSIYLAMKGGPFFSFLASLSIFLGIAYTGGPWPLAYKGLGDLFVFIFFGPVATSSTFYLQTTLMSWDILVASLVPGLWSTALIVVNNLRDQEEDALSNKRTLAVRFGRHFTQVEYTLCVGLGLALSAYYSQGLSLVLVIPLLVPLLNVWRFKDPISLNKTLAHTSIIGLLSVLSIVYDICKLLSLN